MRLGCGKISFVQIVRLHHGVLLRLLYVHHGLLAEAVARRAAADALLLGGEHRQEEVAVVDSAPAPVDVEVAVAVAVAHKGMGVFVVFRYTGVVDRSRSGKFTVDDVHPFRQTVIRTVQVFDVFVVVEVFQPGRSHVCGKCSAGLCCIVHVYGDAHVVHQCGHCRFCRISAVIVILVGHRTPVVRGVAEIGRQNLAVPVVGMTADALFRPFVVVHYLRHGRCHAS